MSYFIRLGVLEPGVQMKKKKKALWIFIAVQQESDTSSSSSSSSEVGRMGLVQTSSEEETSPFSL